MNRKEIFEEWNVNENAIVLDPPSYFDKGLVGVTEDKQHLIYSYQKLTTGNATEKFMNKESGDERNFEDFLSEACEWVDYNTIRSLPYMDSEYRPIIMIEFEGE
jgi:hypothetical protein